MFNNGIVNYENYNNVEKNLKTVLNLANTNQNSKAVEEEIYYNTAKNVGRSLNVTDYNSLSEKIMELGIGQIVITNMSDEKWSFVCLIVLLVVIWKISGNRYVILKREF